MPLLTASFRNRTSGSGLAVTQTGNDADFRDPAFAIGDTATALVDSILDRIGGTAVNSTGLQFVVHVENESQDLGINSVRHDWVRIQTIGLEGETETVFHANMQTHPPEDWIETLVLEFTSRVEIAGGDLYLRRALSNSEATTLEALIGDLKIAEDYARYLANREIIDALIALDPESSFAAGWIITLLPRPLAAANDDAPWTEVRRVA